MPRARPHQPALGVGGRRVRRRGRPVQLQFADAVLHVLEDLPAELGAEVMEGVAQHAEPGERGRYAGLAHRVGGEQHLAEDQPGAVTAATLLTRASQAYVSGAAAVDLAVLAEAAFARGAFSGAQANALMKLVAVDAITPLDGTSAKPDEVLTLRVDPATV